MSSPNMSIPSVFVVIVLTTFAIGLAGLQALGLEEMFDRRAVEESPVSVPMLRKTNAVGPAEQPIAPPQKSSVLQWVKAAEQHLLPFEPTTEAEAAGHAVGIAHLAGLQDRLHHPRRAASLFDASLQLAKQLPTTETRHACCREIALVLAQHGKAEWAWLAALAAKETEAIGESLESVGRFYLQQQDAEQATQAAGLMQARLPRARLWLAISLAEFQRGQTAAAEQALTNAMTAGNELDSVEHLLAADLLPDLGIAQATLGTWEVALRLAEPVESPTRRAEVLEAVLTQQAQAEQPEADCEKLKELWLQEIDLIVNPPEQAAWLARVAEFDVRTQDPQRAELLLKRAQQLLASAEQAEPVVSFEAWLRVAGVQQALGTSVAESRAEIRRRFDAASLDVQAVMLREMARHSQELLTDYAELLSERLLAESAPEHAAIWQTLSEYLGPSPARREAWIKSIAAVNAVAQQAELAHALGKWSPGEPSDDLHPLVAAGQLIGSIEAELPAVRSRRGDTLLARLSEWSQRK